MSVLREQSIWCLFDDVATRVEDLTAVASEGQAISYGALRRASDHLALILEQRYRVSQGATVLVALPKSIDHVIVALALMSVGAVYVPIDTAWPIARLEAIVERTKPALGISHDESTFAKGTDWIFLDDLRSEGHPGGPVRSVGVGTSKSVAYIAFTSGTTGVPKRVQITHSSIIALVKQSIYDNSLADDAVRRVILSLAPPYFDAWTFELWGSLLEGGTLVLYPDRVPTPSKMKTLIKYHSVNLIFCTTSLFNRLVLHDKELFCDIRTVLTGGEMCSEAAIASVIALPSAPQVIHVYGPTECTTFSTYFRVNECWLPGRNSLPIGRPLVGWSIYIFEGNEESADGSLGEILIAGAGLSAGYLGDDVETARRFVSLLCADGLKRRLYRTGDLGFMDQLGNLHIAGRLDDQIKIAGHRIELEEVQRVIASGPHVKEVAVMLLKNVNGDKYIGAVVTGFSSKLNEAIVRRHVSKMLPKYSVPKRIKCVEELPLTPSGKADRIKIKQLLTTESPT